MARFRASGGLRPFGLMNGQAGQTRSQFGMFPGGFQRQTIQSKHLFNYFCAVFNFD
jgi:hypothetical protein